MEDVIFDPVRSLYLVVKDSILFNGACRPEVHSIEKGCRSLKRIWFGRGIIVVAKRLQRQVAVGLAFLRRFGRRFLASDGSNVDHLSFVLLQLLLRLFLFLGLVRRLVRR